MPEFVVLTESPTPAKPSTEILFAGLVNGVATQLFPILDSQGVRLMYYQDIRGNQIMPHEVKPLPPTPPAEKPVK